MTSSSAVGSPRTWAPEPGGAEGHYLEWKHRPLHQREVRIQETLVLEELQELSLLVATDIMCRKHTLLVCTS